MPPELVEVSATRVKADAVMGPMTIEAAERYQLRAALLWAGKLSGLRRCQRWLTEN